MDPHQFQPINLAAFAMSAVALCVALLAMFPGLKEVLSVARDAVLWVALFFVLGIASYWGWQQWQREPEASATVSPMPAKSAKATGFSVNLNTQ